MPLNAIIMNVRRHARHVDPNAYVVQRLKRLPSIEAKLRRQPTMALDQMQDLGGCRAVVDSIADVDALVRRLRHSRQRHELVDKGFQDYIARPAASGYRSVHLPFSYQSVKSPHWNGRVIEVQVRTRSQHAWATAVETVGFFTSQELKAGVGQPEWLRFFALASSVLARREQRPVTPGTPDLYSQLVFEARELAVKLAVRDRLEAYRASLQVTGRDTAAKYFVLALSPLEGVLTMYSYTDAESASTAFALLEVQAKSGQDVVMVGAENAATLRKAYPNYFGDTSLFVELLDDAGVWGD